MRIAQLGGLTVRLSGGTDGKGGGNGPVVILLHGFGAPGNDLVPLADVLDVPTGTRFVFPEGPLTLSFGPRDARAWWLIDMARIAQDQAAGRVRDLSNEIPKGLAPARETMLAFLKEVRAHIRRRSAQDGARRIFPRRHAVLRCDAPNDRALCGTGSTLRNSPRAHRNGALCCRHAKACRSSKATGCRMRSYPMSELSDFAIH